jgi:hypothetical protein
MIIACLVSEPGVRTKTAIAIAESVSKAGGGYNNA